MDKMYISNESLFISVKNLDMFRELIERAKKQTEELESTINELSNYDLHISFENKKETN